MPVEKHSETWRAVRDFAVKRIRENRDALEQQSGVENTAAYRGEIRALRSILKLGAEDVPIESSFEY